MMSYDFETITHGKWILAGEHAVLRQGGAIVFPVLEKKLQLSYRATNQALSASYTGETGQDMHLLFWSVLEQGQQLLGDSINHLTGHFHLDSNLPIGTGMGASAALCVAVARWFKAYISPHQCVFSFAKQLENLFHGKSSGLDIAGVSTVTGSFFQSGTLSPFTPLWKPFWYLSSCNQIGITAHCIAQVDKLWSSDKAQALAIDRAMQDSVHLAKEALLTQDSETGLSKLTLAINQAASCFKDWGLINQNLEQHMNNLRSEGALAVKPTGSGGGGYVLSLWENPPRKTPQFIAI